MRVFVAGGTGVLGRRLVPQLVARGHQVTATTTSTAKLGLLERLGAEAVVMDGLDAVSAGGTVMRYGALYGPGATDDQVELVRKRQFPLVGRANGYASWVHLDDAASATVLAVEQQARGVFNIVDDDPAPASEWLPYLAECAGAKRPMRVPKWLARLLAGEVAVVMMTEGRGFSNAKAKRELGWQLRYPSWRQGFKQELA
ncbi:MAG: NAD-dependent epimerase/dehydratase family protein [Streptosporangiaceae bacterium]